MFAIPECVDHFGIGAPLTIRSLNEVAYDQSHYLNARYMPTAFRKVCAKFQSRVRLGVGIVLERSCGITCPHCSGPAFGRKCRIFDFAPHYHVKLEKKKSIPYINVCPLSSLLERPLINCRVRMTPTTASDLISSIYRFHWFRCSIPQISHLNVPIVSTSAPRFSPISGLGGLCSIVPCPYLSVRVLIILVGWLRPN